MMKCRFIEKDCPNQDGQNPEPTICPIDDKQCLHGLEPEAIPKEKAEINV